MEEVNLSDLQNAAVSPRIAREAKTAMRKLRLQCWDWPRRGLVPVSELFERDLLEGQCWQMTNFVSPLLSPDDTVMRGELTNFQGGYEHAWIELPRKKLGTFVLDPSLGVLCEKNEYYDSMMPEIYGQTHTAAVKKFLLGLWNNPDNRESGKHVWGGAEHIAFSGREKLNAPFYRGSYAVRLDAANGKINRIDLQSYRTDC